MRFCLEVMPNDLLDGLLVALLLAPLFWTALGATGAIWRYLKLRFGSRL